ncbi:putative RpiR family transcriptional regulator [Selenomonas ruminantium subsp. lactilytica TAM6421]|uniref:Putative RpiR family transcriptional regulator n=1 Tax=Selenomonas ruminantium subsp. lactilytica (strain NBRC 103574 / TAM6421) TaxID=927704 RepID=I0GN28_SELRL|nr:MurR/RpiR family transcriptional regulator [Selenomonas ruminantium]BAL82165.1 putative RpiR family transcriptional regulator [Selenomonas ruminantium subsp. lactilytica TAM6421]
MKGLIKQLQEQEGFSESERMIATYLLAHFRNLPGMSTRQLARETFTSSAAIVRFSQKLGFGGYTEFRVKFLADMMRYTDRPHGEELAMTDKDSVHSILDKVTSIELDSIKETRGMLEPGDFVRALAIINKSDHIDFYAMDNNLDIANMAATGFIMANKCSTVHPAMTMQYLQATGAPKDHVAFFISRTGENRMLLDIAHLLKLRGNPIIALTASSNSSLANMAEVVFPVATVKSMEELGPRVFLTGAKYVMDILFAVLMTRVDFHSAQQKEQWLSKHFYY